MDTYIGGPRHDFPQTRGTLLRQLRGQERSDALARLIQDYWKPIYCLVRRTKSNEEAKDLVQDFFATMVLEKSLFDRFDPDRGAFRSFLKASVINFLRDAAKRAMCLKRGGRRLALEGIEECVPDPAAPSPEEAFDAAWKEVVLERTVELLKLRLETRGGGFEVFRRVHLQDETPTYQQVAAELGLSADKVKHHLVRAREEFRRVLRDVVSEYVSDEQELQAELKELFG